jgi:DNA-binding CsgD family transcriptional regulator
MTIRDDAHWLQLVDSFHAAAVGEHSWDAALQGLADATGSRSAQLAVLHSGGASVPFNTITNIDPGIFPLFIKTAAINPRVIAANTAPVLKVLTDWDFITPEAYRRDLFCQEVLQPFDIPWVCIATLERNEQGFVAMTVIRSRSEGHITPEQRQVFASIAPHVRTAVRTHIALQGHGVSVLTKSMETLSIPAFVCDRSGKVVTLTRAAEALVEEGRTLQLQAGTLRATQWRESQMLHDAIDAAAVCGLKPGPPVSRTVIIRGADSDGTPVVLDVFALPAQSSGLSLPPLAPRVLVVARGSKGSGAHRSTILSTLYGLTSAEVEIALQLAEGTAPEAIAANRCVAVGTVRSQIKAILAKVGVRRQIELIARLNQL